MGTPEDKLRLMQVGCALFLVLGTLLKHFGNREPTGAISVPQLVVVWRWLFGQVFQGSHYNGGCWPFDPDPNNVP